MQNRECRIQNEREDPRCRRGQGPRALNILHFAFSVLHFALLKTVAPLILLAMPAAAPAQVKVAIDPSKPGTVDILTPVVAPEARCVALGEAQGLLAFGHDRPYTDADLSLVKLDAKGTPSAAATRWKVPTEKWQEKIPSYILSVAFHPKLPLLYVWRDVPLNYNVPATSHPPEHRAY